MSKRWPYDEEHISDEESLGDPPCDDDVTTNVGTLDAVTSVLEDILEELSLMHELLRQLMERGFPQSTHAQT